MQRPDWDTYFMLQAEIAKLRSNCLSRHVGAVIVKDNRQIATGYNGTPSGIKNCFEGGCPRCVARMNGEIKTGENLDRCLCTHAEAIARIVVMTDYSEDGTKLLSEANIVLTKLDFELLKPWVSLLIKDPKAYSSIAKS